MAHEEGGVLPREVIRDNDIKILLNFGFLEVASIAFFIAGTLFLNGDLETFLYSSEFLSATVPNFVSIGPLIIYLGLASAAS